MGKAKYSLDDLDSSSSKLNAPDAASGSGDMPFTDRVAHMRSFVKALHEQAPGEQRVLVYHGVGGIGKSRLCAEFMRTLAGESAKAETLGLLSDPAERASLCWGQLDFQEPQVRDAPLALFTMRKRLAQRHGLRFPAFDFAYAEWWAKTNPNVPLATSDLPFLEEVDFLAECAEIAEDIPGVGLITKIPALLNKLGAKIKDYRLQQRVDVLKRLPAMKSHEIADLLPAFWALDLKDEMERNGHRVVLFLDTHEALREGRRAESQRHRLEAWVREWVAQLPDVLWVVTGRDRLYWHEVDPDWAGEIEHHLVGDLSEPDVRRLLTKSGLTEPDLQDAIVATANGVPYDLELALGIYHEKLKNGETPTPEDFMGTPHELHDRFFRYLDDDALVRALELLAVPRTWGRTLYAVLAEHFDPGFPVGQFDRLERFAFVTQLESGVFALHERTREALHAHGGTDPADVHAFLFEHYKQALAALQQPRDVTPPHERALTEAFYHGQHVLGLEAFANWMHSAQKIFNDAARWRLLEGLYEDLLARQEAALDPEHKALATTLNNLAGLYEKQGRYGEAEPHYHRALAVCKKALGEDHPVVATMLNNLAGLYEKQGRYGEAEPHYHRALAVRKKALGEDHPSVATTLNNLAGLYEKQGRYGEAEPRYQRAFAIREQALGEDHPSVATTLNNLAVLYEKQGRYGEAEPLHQRALVILEKALGTDHPNVATSLNNLAGLYESQGRYGEAEPHYHRALAVRKKVLGEDHPVVATMLNNLAGLYEKQGRYGEAEPHYHRALAVRKKVLGEDHPVVATMLNNLAGLYEKQGRYGEAEPHYHRALAVRKKALGEDHPSVATTLNNLAGLYKAQGRYGEAEPRYQRALAIFERALGEDHPSVATTLNNLAGLYEKQGRYGEAEPRYQRALAVRKKALGTDHPSVATALNNLAGLYVKQGRYEEAEPLYVRSLKILDERLGPDHPNTRAGYANYEHMKRERDGTA